MRLGSSSTKLVARLPGTKKPLIISHRGASKNAPENTMAAYNLAWELNSDGIELDIRETADKKIVCSHDDDLFRVSNKKLKISNLKHSQLKKIDVGSWKDKKYIQEEIPLLKDVLSNIPTNKKVFIERKYHRQRPKKLIKIIESNIKFSQCHFLCFSPEIIKKLNAKAPSIKATLNLRPDDFDNNLNKITKIIKKSKSYGVSLQIRSVKDVTLVKEIKSLGFYCLAWTVNHKTLIKNLIKTKVDGIITDDPEKANYII